MFKRIKAELNKKGEIFLSVKAKPGAGRQAIKEVVLKDGEWVLRVNLSSRAEAGKANRELLKLLEKELGGSAMKIKIVRGEKARNKLLKIKI